PQGARPAHLPGRCPAQARGGACRVRRAPDARGRLSGRKHGPLNGPPGSITFILGLQQRARTLGAGTAAGPRRGGALPIWLEPDSYAPPREHIPPRHAPVAQLDRAPDYESGGQEFESLRARHYNLLIESDYLGYLASVGRLYLAQGTRWGHKLTWYPGV